MSARRVALVAGANRGIGREIARRLAEDHHFLVLAGARDPGKVDLNGSVIPIQLDIADPASVDAVGRRIASDPGRLDVLVNSAGVDGPADEAAQSDLERAHRVLETNLFGALRLAQATLPLLRVGDASRIVSVSSGIGQLAEMGGGHSAYRISEAALSWFTRVLAAEEPGIRVNSICPGRVRTDLGGSTVPRLVEQGADTAVWLATGPGVPTGGFLRDREPIPR